PPPMFAGVHVDREQTGERRPQDRQPTRTKQGTGAADVVVFLLEWHRSAQGNDVRNPMRLDVEHARLGIDGPTGPVGAAADTGIARGAALTGGRVQRAIIEAVEDFDRLSTYLGCEIDQVLLPDTLYVERRRSRREGLRRRSSLAYHGRRRYRTILDRPD